MFYEGFGLECAQCETVGFVIDFHLTTKNKMVLQKVKVLFIILKSLGPVFNSLFPFNQKSL